MQREHALNLRSLARKFAIPYLQQEFGESFDYVKVRSRRMELMAEELSRTGLETKKGLRELLQWLREMHIPAAVATATDLVRAKEYLDSAGIFGYFDKVVCATMVESGKPKPDIYLYAAQQLGFDPSECVALEDSPNGVRSAASAGCITIMVPDLTPPDEELTGLIHAQAESLADVPDIIKEL